MFDFCREQGVDSWDEIVRCRIKEAIDQPFWKLLELDGKYGQDYISEGVLKIEGITGEIVNRSTGKWSNKILQENYEYLSDHPNPSAHHEFKCQLEHVISRKYLIQQIIAGSISVDDAVDKYLIGCVVLASEHARLPRDLDSLGDPWLKYRQAKPCLRVWSRSMQKWVVN
jgi:hypothetical protein